MYYVYHRLTKTLMCKTTSIKILNEYDPMYYEIVTY